MLGNILNYKNLAILLRDSFTLVRIPSALYCSVKSTVIEVLCQIAS